MEKELCLQVKKEIEEGNMDEAYGKITDAMKKEPDSGIPHNLLGLWEESRGNHAGAMKHFRAAWALEPTLLAARWNMDVYGGMGRGLKPAYTEDEVPKEPDIPQKMNDKCVYDEHGIGKFVKR